MHVDRVDEPQRELEHRKENAQLHTCGVPRLRKIPRLGVSVRHTGVGEDDEAQRIVDFEDVLGVDDVLLP